MEFIKTAGRMARKACGLALAFVAFSGTAWGFDLAPEMDPGSMTGALALLAAGVFLVRDRYRRK